MPAKPGLARMLYLSAFRHSCDSRKSVAGNLGRKILAIPMLSLRAQPSSPLSMAARSNGPRCSTGAERQGWIFRAFFDHPSSSLNVSISFCEPTQTVRIGDTQHSVSSLVLALTRLAARLAAFVVRSARCGVPIASTLQSRDGAQGH